MSSRVQQCRVHDCGRDAVDACSWRPMQVNEHGEREFGKVCGMALCGPHVQTVAGRPLCLWHSVRAAELLAATPPGGEAA